VKFMTKLLLCAASLLPLSAANIIYNGSFESYSGSPSPTASEATTLSDGFLGITEWDTLGPCEATNCLLLIGTLYTENAGQFEAQDGTRSVDLTGSGHAAFTGGISQAVNLSTGLSYTLTFWLGNMDDAAGNYGGASSLEVLINGVSMGTFTNSASTPGLVNWAQRSLTFTATVDLNAITFRDATPLADHYAGLDNVFLDVAQGGATEAAVAEPGTLALVAAALIGVGLVRWRGATDRYSPDLRPGL